MSPVVKVEMKEPRKREEEEEEKCKTRRRSIIIAGWDSVSSVPSAAVSCGEKRLVVVVAACSQTGRYSPQPSTRRLAVGERVGRCAPPGWKCPKLSQRQPSHLHNAAFFLLFLTLVFFFFLSPLPYLRLSWLALLEVFFFFLFSPLSQHRALLSWAPATDGDSRDSTPLFCAGTQRIPSQRALWQLLCGFDVNCSISPGRRGPQPHPLSNVAKQKVECGEQVCPAQTACTHECGAFSANTYSANICQLNKTAGLQSKCNALRIHSWTGYDWTTRPLN